MSFYNTMFLRSNFDFHYENLIIKDSDEEKILETTIENKLDFKAHMLYICRVENQKLSAL